MIIFALIIVVPTLTIVSPVLDLYNLKIGELDINLADINLIFVIIYLGFRRLTRNPKYIEDRKNKYLITKVNSKIITFAVTLLSVTVIYALFISSNNFTAQLVSLCRFLFQLTIYFVLCNSLNKISYLKWAHICFNCLGYLVLISSYISIVIFYLTGEKIGEIQTSQNGVRYFGLIGDQLGFIGLIFIFISLVCGQKINAVIWGITVIATGTRGAIISLLIGLIIYYLPKLSSLASKFWIRIADIKFLLLVLFGVFVYLLFYAKINFVVQSIVEIVNYGVERLTNISVDDFSAKQRQLTWQIALKVFLSNPLIGVGYSGFRFVALQYGADSLLTGYDLANSTANASNQYLQVATDAGLIGIVVFISLFSSILKLLQVASHCPIPELSKFFMAGRIWLWSLLIGNQTAAWLVPGSPINYLLWLVLGMAAATVAIGSDVNKVANQGKHR